MTTRTIIHFEFYQGEDKLFRWRLYDTINNVIATGRACNTRAVAQRDLDIVMNTTLETKVEFKKDDT